MAAPLAYLGVIAIWATTPLAIKISNTGFSPVTAATGRIVLAALIACVLVAVLMPKAGLKRRHWKLYLAASIGLFPNMQLVYWAAQYIPSGLISVIFATSPFTMGLCAMVILGDKPFTPVRVLGLCLSLVGMVIVAADQISLSDQAWIGIALMIVSNFLFSLSNVLVKKLNAEVKAFEQTLGALVFAVPGFVACWVLSGGGIGLPNIPAAQSQQAMLAMVYLASIGSIVGFFAFFTVLRQLPMSAVALIPLITPVLAVALGVWVANEVISMSLVLGSAMILLGLAVHELLPRYAQRRRDTALSASGQLGG